TITDDGRIRAALPTLSRLVEAGARVVVISHLGRPKGAPEEKYSLRPVAGRLGELLDQDVAFATDTVGSSAQETVRSEEHTSELQSRFDLVCRLLLEKKKNATWHQKASTWTT